MTHYYVYYRVDPMHGAALRRGIERLFIRMQAQTGVQGRWLRRRDDASTYMEIYEGVNDEQAFEAALARESASLGLERKVERFICA